MTYTYNNKIAEYKFKCTCFNTNINNFNNRFKNSPNATYGQSKNYSFHLMRVIKTRAGFK